jgi:hypothetical protein
MTVAIFSGVCRYFSSFLCSELAPLHYLPRLSGDCGDRPRSTDPQTQSAVTAVLVPFSNVIDRWKTE